MISCSRRACSRGRSTPSSSRRPVASASIHSRRIASLRPFTRDHRTRSHRHTVGTLTRQIECPLRDSVEALREIDVHGICAKDTGGPWQQATRQAIELEWRTSWPARPEHDLEPLTT
jgi:hypothetical protein